MAGQLMLVNPRKRRKVRKFRRNPTDAAPRKRRRRRGIVTKARERVGKSVKRARRSAGRFGRRAGKLFSKVRRGARRSRRKPMSVQKMLTNPASFIRSQVLPAGLGAAGALALDAAYAYLPIPPNLKTGPLAPVVKIGVVGLLGATVSHFAPQKQVRFVHTAVTAAITVIAYGFLKSQLQNAMPNLRLGEFVEDDTICPIPGVTPLSYYQAGQFIPGINEYVSGDDMSEYVSGAAASMGWSHPDGDYGDLVS